MEEYRVSRVVALVAFTFMSVHFEDTCSTYWVDP
jgi:hypothetical protein